MAKTKSKRSQSRFQWLAKLRKKLDAKNKIKAIVKICKFLISVPLVVLIGPFVLMVYLMTGLFIIFDWAMEEVVSGVFE